MNKDNTGVLFINQKSNDRQPDFKGSITIGGVEYKVAGWKKQSASGKNYVSLVCEKNNAGDSLQR